MHWFILISVAPVVVGASVAVVFWAARRRGLTALRGHLALLAVSAGLTPVLVIVFGAVLGVMPMAWGATPELHRALAEGRFLIPLVAGGVAVAVLAFSAPR